MKRKLRVLVFIDWYLPGFRSGGPVRSVQGMVHALSNEADFYIVTRDTDYCEVTPYSNVTPGTWTVHEGASRVMYLSGKQLSAYAIRSVISEVRPDAVYVNGIYSLYFSILPAYVASRAGIRTVVAARGMLSAGSLSVKSIKKQFFLRFAKFTGLFSKCIFHATSKEEEKDIKSWFPNVQVLRAGNVPVLSSSEPRSRSAGPLKLVSIARIAPEKNQLFAINALRQVKEQVQFDLYGPAYDASYLERCRRAIAALPPNVTATIHDAVEPPEVTRILATAHFLYLPSTGENFGHIIYQSLSGGTPVIISDRTPWKDLSRKRAGYDLPLDERTFATAIDKVASDPPSQYREMSQGALNTARDYLADPQLIARQIALFR